MIGLGTIINSAAIIVGGVFGLLFGKLLKERVQDTLQKANGVCVLFIGIAGAMEGMLRLSGSTLSSGRSMLIVASLALGALVGELMNIEHWVERFGEWLKIKTGNAKDKDFVNEKIILADQPDRFADRLHRCDGGRRFNQGRN